MGKIISDLGIIKEHLKRLGCRVSFSIYYISGLWKNLFQLLLPLTALRLPFFETNLAMLRGYS